MSNGRSSRRNLAIPQLLRCKVWAIVPLVMRDPTVVPTHKGLPCLAEARNAAGSISIRLIVWLLVLGSLLAILVTIRLPRPGAPKAPETDRNAAGGDVAATSAQSTNDSFVAPTNEPIARKTWSDWVQDLKSTNAEVVKAARQALKDLGPDAAPALPQLAQMLKDGRTCNRASMALVEMGTNS
jgi:hypothetical protein